MTNSEKRTLKQELQEALGQALRQLRERRRDKPSQETMAAAAGMDRSYWGDLERGERSLTLYNLWRIAGALEMTPSQLVLTIDKLRLQVHSKPVKPVVHFSAELKRLQKFMDALPTMKWFADRKTNCLYCNRPLLEFVGRTQEELSGQRGWEVIHQEDREKNAEHNRKAFARRQPFITKLRVRRADGEYIWMVQQATPQFTSKGVFIGFLGTMIPEPDEPKR